MHIDSGSYGPAALGNVHMNDWNERERKKNNCFKIVALLLVPNWLRGA